MSIYLYEHLPIAPKWKLFLAKIFGSRVECIDENTKIVCYLWLGRFYFTKMDLSEPPSEPNAAVRIESNETK